MSHTNLFTPDSACRAVAAGTDEIIAATRQHVARRFWRGRFPDNAGGDMTPVDALPHVRNQVQN